MEDSKPIIFDDGLREAFEHPLKKYPELQKGVLIQPDETDKEDIFLKKQLIPYVSVMWYLCTHDSAVFDGFMKFIKKFGAIKSIPRLKTNEVFEVLSRLSSRNASILLGEIKCTDGIYSELRDSLEDGDKTRFVAALKDCNTTPINPPLKILQKTILIEEKLKKVEFYLGSPQKIREEFASKLDYYFNNSIRELFGFAFSSEESNESVQAFANGVKAAKRLNSAENNDNELTAISYDFMFGLFSSLKGKDVLNDDAIDVIDFILKQPPFGNEYYQYQRYWENGESDDAVEKFFARHPKLQIPELLQETNPNAEGEESIEEVEVIEEPQSTPQIIEPQTSKTPAEIEAQKDALRKKKEAEAFNLIRDLLINTAGEKDFFKEGFTLGQLIEFFEKILTVDSVLDAVTKTNNKTKYVYKGIVLEKFCNIIGYLIHKGVISKSQAQVAKALFGMEETKTAILNLKPEDKTSGEAFDREEYLFTTCRSYISNGFKDTPKSFIDPKIRDWFDVTLDSVRKPQLPVLENAITAV